MTRARKTDSNDKEVQGQIAFGLIKTVTFLCLIIPLFHQMRVNGYSLFNSDGLTLIGLTGLYTLISVTLLRSIIPFLWPLFVAIHLTLLIDFFLPNGGDVRPTLMYIFIGATAILWILRSLPLLLCSVFLTGFWLTDFLAQTPTPISIEDRHAPAADSKQVADINPSPIIHIILDAFTAPATLEKEQKYTADAIRASFLDRGFILYDQAFSRYDNTAASLSTLMNSAAPQAPKNLYTVPASGFEISLTNNALIEQMNKSGRTAYIFQTNYMDFCAGLSQVKCRTFSKNHMARPPLLEGLSLMERMGMITLITAAQSRLLTDGKYLLRKYEIINLPQVRPPASYQIQNTAVSGFLKAVPNHSYILIHSLMSHAPYAVDKNCQITPPTQWANDMQPRNVEERKTAYGHYAHQLSCSMKTVQEWLDLILTSPLGQRATIIIQGDHGSRLSQTPPSEATQSTFSRQNIADHYPALFAVRYPDSQKTDQKVNTSYATDRLFHHHVVCGHKGTLVGKTDSIIFLRGKDGGPYVAYDWHQGKPSKAEDIIKDSCQTSKNNR